MKKIFYMMIVLLLLISSIGCSKPSDKAGQPSNEPSSSSNNTNESKKENIELTVWWWGEQEAPGAEKWMNETVKSYEDKHPNIKIKSVLQPTDQVAPAFKSAAAAKSGPDIQFFWGGIWTLEDAWMGNIVPISDYIPKEEYSHYMDKNDRVYDGKLWGDGWFKSVYAIPYRKDIFEKAGLDPENPPKDWQEFMNACEKIKKAGYIPLAAGLKDGWLAGWIWQLMGKQNLDGENDMLEVVTGNKKFADSKYSDWLDKLAELRDKGYINNDVTSLDYQQGPELFLQGKAAMTFGNSNLFPSWIKQAGEDKVGMMDFPNYGTGKLADTATVAIQGLSITSWSEHKQEAADFLMFMHTEDRLNAWYKATGVLPADDRFDISQIDLPQMKKVFEMAKNQPSIDLEHFIPSVAEDQAIFPGVQLLFSGEKTPAEVAKEVDKTLERWRKENPEDLKNFKNWSKK